MPAPKTFVAVDQKSGTPRNGIILETVLAAILVMIGSYDQLTDLLVFVNWMFFIVGIASVFILRRKRKDLINSGAYQVPFYPVVPVIGITGAGYVLVQTLVSGAITSLIGLGLFWQEYPPTSSFEKWLAFPRSWTRNDRSSNRGTRVKFSGHSLNLTLLISCA